MQVMEQKYTPQECEALRKAAELVARAADQKQLDPALAADIETALRDLIARKCSSNPKKSGALEDLLYQRGFIV